MDQRTYETLVRACELAEPCLEDWAKTAGFGEVHRRDMKALEAIRIALHLHRHGGRDKCEVCGGERGGMPGNENVVAGVIMCDHCTAEARKDDSNPP